MAGPWLPLDLNQPRPRLLRVRQLEREHAALEPGADPVAVHTVAQGELAVVVGQGEFARAQVRLSLPRRSAVDGQDAVLDADLQVVTPDAGHVGHHHQAVGLLVDIHGRCHEPGLLPGGWRGVVLALHGRVGALDRVLGHGGSSFPALWA